jgi:hypothetical protein
MATPDGDFIIVESLIDRDTPTGGYTSLGYRAASSGEGSW